MGRIVGRSERAHFFLAQSNETSVAKTGKKDIVIRVRLKTRTAVRARKKRVGHGETQHGARKSTPFLFLSSDARPSSNASTSSRLFDPHAPPFLDATRAKRLFGRAFQSARDPPSSPRSSTHFTHLGRCFTSSVSKVR
jgi:hypothetical protein